MAEETLCFVLKGDKILMINRNKPPFMGMWNVVGGHLENGETLKECAIREIKEESGISVKEVEKISTFTWNYDDDIGHVFVAKVENNDTADLKFPVKTEEGIIDFKEIDWILNEKNYGVIEDLRVFIKDIKDGVKNDYHMIYENSKLVKYIKK